ncbi:unnamed protein product [Durusdinium trenchii]|uniref:C3H1-type domain-containing protein n=1 Tax=Durusdinium trenchii TaxID=1381693 RepID=A0ABP0Q7X4_9DINO
MATLNHVVFVWSKGTLVPVPVQESLQPWARPVRPALNFKCLNGMKPLVLSDDSECDLPHTARYTGAVECREDQKAHGSNASSAEVTTSGGTRGAAPSQLESDSDFEGLGFIPGLGDESEEEVTEVFAFNTWESHQYGTCKPCRFFHAKEEGCRIGASCISH